MSLLPRVTLHCQYNRKLLPSVAVKGFKLHYSNLQVQNKPVFLFDLTELTIADNFLSCQRRAFLLLARCFIAGVAELADALDSGSSG